MASGTSDGLVLISDLGKADPIYNQRETVDGTYTRAKCEGSRSFFVCYDRENFSFNSKTLIVESTAERDFGRPIRSLQGYDKQGLVLFTDSNYCGQGSLFTQDDPNILDQFPQGGQGVSSMVVHRGTWAMYSEPNHRGIRISVDGKDSFPPGTRIPSGKFNDKVRSVKLL